MGGSQLDGAAVLKLLNGCTEHLGSTRLWALALHIAPTTGNEVIANAGRIVKGLSADSVLADNCNQRQHPQLCRSTAIEAVDTAIRWGCIECETESGCERHRPRLAASPRKCGSQYRDGVFRCNNDL